MGSAGFVVDVLEASQSAQSKLNEVVFADSTGLVLDEVFELSQSAQSTEVVVTGSTGLLLDVLDESQSAQK